MGSRPSRLLIERSVSRRTLIRGAFLGSAGLLTASLIGCDDNETTGSPSGSGATYPDPGISDTEIKIGNTLPYSGPIGIAGQQLGGGGSAYFSSVNEDQGGINGRKVSFLTYDDAYNPTQTVDQTRRLIQEDKVFILWGGLGTPQQQAATPFIEQNGIPRLMLETAATQFSDPKKNPLVTIGIPSYFGKGALLGRYVTQNRPNARIAVLNQNDDLGKSFVMGFEDGLGAKRSQIVSRQTYEISDSTLDSQFLALKNSGADVFFFNSSGGKFLTLGQKATKQFGWQPEILLAIPGTRTAISSLQPGGLDTVTGAIGLASDKDPLDPQYQSDPAIQAAQRIIDKYKPSLKYDDAALGYITAVILVEILKRMKQPTRQAAMESARSLANFDANGLMLPGVTWSGSQNSNFMIRKAKYVRFDGQRWQTFGELVEIPDPPATA